MKKIPEFDNWKKMSDEERRNCQHEWNAYAGEGESLVKQIRAQFCEEYKDIPNLTIDGIGIYHGGAWCISISHPFVFDRRKIPESYLGIEIRGECLEKDLPKEFRIKDSKKEYIWAYQRYEKYVDRCADEIRSKLGNKKITRYEMLCALCGKDFDEWIKQCHKWERDGTIPRYTQ